MSDALPRAFGGPGCSAVIRHLPEDFRVDELPLVSADGAGEHRLLQIEKRLCNTDWVAGLLARHAGVPRRDVSYAGMKDRRAVTRQWFSVRLAGRQEPDWALLNSDQVTILEAQPHSRKLRTGALRGNRFEIVLRQLDGDTGRLESQLQRIRLQGIPNYFGEQRFGRGGNNLQRAQALFQGRLQRVKRHQRGLYLSAARSLLFNQVLAQRVEAGSWNRLLPGERLMLDGSRNSFPADPDDTEIEARLQAMDIHPSGPLWGRGEEDTAADVLLLERTALAEFADWQAGLEQAGLKRERRSLRAPVRELQWRFDDQALWLTFTLPKGSYATVLLDELAECRLPELAQDAGEGR